MAVPRIVLPMLATCTIVFGADVAVAQGYPNRVVRLVTSEAAGGSDLAARVLATGLAGSLGQSVVVENRGGGVIAGEMVVKAPPDGHTLLVYGNTLWLLPLMRSSVSYDTIRDFLPVSLLATSPAVLLVHPSVTANSVQELVALAKARPGLLNYASAALGTSNHLAAELFKAMAGVDIVRVGFKGGPSALNSLIAGETHVMFALVGAGMPQARAGRVKALAVTGANPSALAPGLPTMAASGLPGFVVAFTPGLFVRAGTPEAIIERLNREIVRLLGQAEIRDKFLSVGLEPLSSTPNEFAATIRTELAVLGKVIRDAGIRED